MEISNPYRNFIFDEEVNRTVSVHAGGIYAALKYIFKADRIINELENQENKPSKN